MTSSDDDDDELMMMLFLHYGICDEFDEAVCVSVCFVACRLDEQEIGSGCVAQVHKGRLRPEHVPAGSDGLVVVKVLHPGVRRQVRMRTGTVTPKRNREREAERKRDAIY